MVNKVTNNEKLSLMGENCIFSGSKYSFSGQKGTQNKTSSFLWRRICVPFFLWLLTSHV